MMKYVYETISKILVVTFTVAAIIIAYNQTIGSSQQQTTGEVVNDLQRVGDCIVVKGKYEVCK